VKAKTARLTSTDLNFVIDHAERVLAPLANERVKRLKLPLLSVCGDVHGQYKDMISIFEKNGEPSTNNPYLFNGDFVDRGPNSAGCIATLLLYKIIDPTSVYLNKGNHELIEMNAYYGFRKELKDDPLFLRFNKLFELLPVVHVVNNKFCVVHGGIPVKNGVLLDDLNTNPNLAHEFLWNDPTDKPGVHENPRGEGVFRFGPDITERFLKENGLTTLIRSHEMVENGFEWSQNNMCLTVFSAPNYGGHFRNKGAFVRLSGESVECVQFKGVIDSKL
jgi:serine/threonine-protein phosphatase 5